jgi:general secretion pathway protein G
MRNLARRVRRRLTASDGYTLTEMLIVIGIIALIAAVLTPQLMGQMGRSRAKAAQLQLETVASAVELFRTDVGRYPTKEEGLQALLQDPGADGWTGPYLKDSKSIVDPWNRPQLYEVDLVAMTFSVASLGADGKVGGGGVARDLKVPTPMAAIQAAP